jgi:hypothetical protein
MTSPSVSVNRDNSRCSSIIRSPLILCIDGIVVYSECSTSDARPRLAVVVNAVGKVDPILHQAKP